MSNREFVIFCQNPHRDRKPLWHLSDRRVINLALKYRQILISTSTRFIFLCREKFDRKFIFTGLTLKTDIQTSFDVADISSKPLIACQDKDSLNLGWQSIQAKSSNKFIRIFFQISNNFFLMIQPILVTRANHIENFGFSSKTIQ